VIPGNDSGPIISHLQYCNGHTGLQAKGFIPLHFIAAGVSFLKSKLRFKALSLNRMLVAVTVILATWEAEIRRIEVQG
jgi:hypothetical protein